MANENTSIAIVGCGKMGEAILRGWLNSTDGIAASLDAKNFGIVQPDKNEADRISSQYNVYVAESVADLTNNDSAFDVVVLAVKPQVMSDVLDEFSQVDGIISPKTLFVTIAAGLPTTFFEEKLSSVIDAPAHVVRVMPNMPLQIGMGASAVAKGKNATDEETNYVNALFEALGTSLIVDESQIDAVCAISGGGPAYFAYMVEALAKAGESLGLSREISEKLALTTMGGTYHAIVETDVTPCQMRESVCSPGGTTLAALASLDDGNFTEDVIHAMEAAVNRAEELRG